MFRLSANTWAIFRDMVPIYLHVRVEMSECTNFTQDRTHMDGSKSRPFFFFLIPLGMREYGPAADDSTIE